MATYHDGDIAELRTTFKSTDSGAIGDPTTVQIEIMDPSGVRTVYTYGVDAMAREAEGKYRYDLGPLRGATTTQTWRYRWISTGAFAGGSGDLFIQVAPTVFV